MYLFIYMHSQMRTTFTLDAHSLRPTFNAGARLINLRRESLKKPPYVTPTCSSFCTSIYRLSALSTGALVGGRDFASDGQHQRQQSGNRRLYEYRDDDAHEK
jgi:hypothetical protein